MKLFLMWRQRKMKRINSGDIIIIELLLIILLLWHKHIIF